MPPASFNVQHTSANEIRRLFNEGSYREMIDDGRLIPEFLRNAHLKGPEAKGNPPCTFRQMIRYRDANGNPIVEVFQYLRPDRTLGPSGLSDPKRLWIGRTVLVAESQPLRSILE